MEDTVFIDSFNETYCHVSSLDQGIVEELSAYFTFKVPGAQFTPKYKAKVWDGKIRLMNKLNGKIYKGLIHYVEDFCKERNYPIQKDSSLNNIEKKFNVDIFEKTLNLKLNLYDEQKIAIDYAINNERCLLLSPTSSGKSAIIYSLVRYYLENVNKKILIVVPTVSLVNQLMSDFREYSDSFDVDKNVHEIFSGKEKSSDKPVFITTWQSVYKQPEEYFNLFDVIICDEAHSLKSDAIKGIFESAKNVKYRVGLTGTLDDTQSHKLVIEGLTGKVFNVTTTNELMKQGKVSKLEIVCSVLKYPDSIKRDIHILREQRKFSYQDELKFVVNYENRSLFISKLVNMVPDDKNILILSVFKNHIKILKDVIEKNSKRKVIVVTGDVSPEDRETIRKLAEYESNVVIIATYGVYSTGVNIKNLQYIIKASPSKSPIRVLQSIGRGLRKDGKTNQLKVIDIIDDLSFKGYKNFLYNHFFERIQIYIKQKFSYKINHINI